MKKLISKIKNKISNTGSGLILVIVALGFVGILAGALLTAVAYVYRLKLYDYNAKSNFYYLEQAMDEIYAGVGTKTMSDMQQAYQDTREKVIYYDVKTNTYKNIGNSAANKMFKDSFMSRIAQQSFYNIAYKDDGSINKDDGLVKELQGLYSNDTIELVSDKIKVVKLDENGKNYTGASGQALAKVVIKNVTLRRTAEYNRSSAKGSFTQTISTDIEINRPDFDVQFNSNNLDIDNLFSFCMIADSGVEINENQGSKLTINGNIYAASDFYNKTYNRYDDISSNRIKKEKFTLTRTSDDGEDASVDYNMNIVSNKQYGSDSLSSLRNYNLYSRDTSKSYLYDGYNDNSKYSGLYIDGANVSILASYVIVPGSLSIMNSGELSLYGRNGTEISESNVWVDDLVMAGYVPKGYDSTTKAYTDPRGSNAFLDANLYVKDDTQIESNNASLKLTGGYYGYSNSNTSDDRVFVPTTKKDGAGRYIYQQSVIDNGATILENRGHYNSSSIIVNSENATLDMSTLDTLYIAGRSYVELSHQKTGSSSVKKDIKYDDDGNATDDVTYKVDEEKNSYEYDPDVDDYRTGESVSIKSSQLAYVPEKQPVGVKADGTETTDPDEIDHYQCSLSTKLGNAYLFQKYFGKGILAETVTNIPVIYSKDTVNNEDNTTSDKTMYYIDFDYVAAKKLYDASKFEIQNDANKGTYGDYLKKCFIQDYFDYLDYVDDFKNHILINIPSSVDQDILAGEEIKDILNQVTYYEDHLAGEIAIPNMSSNNVHTYSSGVVTYTGQKDSTNSNSVIFKVNEKNQYTDVNSTVQTVNFKVITAKNSVIDSTLEGSTVKAFNVGTDTNGNSVLVNNTTNFSNEYQKHYNYVKWALMDIEGTSDEAALVDDIVSNNGEGCITPLNRYLNFDNIKDSDPLLDCVYDDTLPDTDTHSPTEINPSNLDLGTYKVWISDDIDNEGLSIECTKADKNTITGIIITKGDVYFKTQAEIKADHPSWSDQECKEAVCNNFNGLIITGGKIYVNNNVTSINATDLCRNIINSCLTKASQAGTKETDEIDSDEALEMRKEGAKAIRVLSIFKAYEKDAESAKKAAKEALASTSGEGSTDEKENADSPLSISNIDYSDVVRYNNWMRNVD